MTDEDIADTIAKSLDPLLIGKQKADILRAFGFIISSMSLDCPCTNIDENLSDVRAAAEGHFALNAKQALQ
ncbi:hypothetical protein MPC4_170018 [Methylocella tundrae]|uniref:Uncharacterized protein n=1 Tax=Methylocella tundrae TaxID=227605 RepID=A0A8B6M373_METTU|nr:hypothetical protein [Methylocella tundrae]VTZ26097.1 hypothetical protein MPC1_2840001 [Methylocella tundrae]VTZ49487.1 hypothetical protein MPC4_170018 [Methylocella tundrae]